MDTISLAIVLAALLVGLNIGGNSAANAIGVIVGSKILSFRKAALLVSFFMLIGALLQGGAVTKTIGSEIAPLPGSEDKASYLEVDKKAVFAALLAATLFVGAATLFSIPVATSHTMVGAIVGVLFISDLAGKINTELLWKITLSWILTPVAAIILSWIIYRHMVVPLSQKLGIFAFNQVFRILLIFGAVFLAYSIGANNTGNAVGPVIGSKAFTDQLLMVFSVGVAMGFGASAFSRGVVETVGKKIADLGPTMAFTAQISAATVIYVFALFGIPISSTQAVVGGVIGAGLTKGVRTVNLKTVEYILVGWVLTPVAAGLLSAFIYSMI